MSISADIPLRRHAFREETAGALATRPESADPAEAAPVKPKRKRHLRLPGSLWVTAYGFGLLLLIVIYFAVILGSLAALAELQGRLVHSLWSVSGLWFIRVNVAFLLLFLITRLATHLWRGIVGLVTQQYDSADEAVGGIALPEASYPELYAAVAEVGDKVTAPRPDEIRLTYRPDCYTVELRSFALSTDRRLVLVIGLPHFEVMTSNELKVIIAHELAHFGGGDTRLGVFAFRFVETLRQALLENANSSWRWIDPVAWLSWVYFHMFLFLSAPMRKNQELRADGYSALVYGGEFAAHTLLKDWALERQFEETLSRFLVTDALPGSEPGANLFRQFGEGFHDLTPEGSEYLERRLEQEEPTSFWDSHPTVHERMRNMRRFPSQQLSEPVPAYFLLPDVESLEARLQEQVRARQPAFPPKPRSD